MVFELVDLHAALEKDEVIPCFQPVVELRTGLLIGFEVLARWQHPTLGAILPPNFISLAEEHGLIGALTQKIVCKAFESTAALPGPFLLAINVSPVQLQYSSLPGQLQKAAQDTGFSLERVTIEITESALLHKLERVKRVAEELKAMGCRLALDDFGTGYSSLAHLQALPFDELKIDRSFVSSMTITRESRKIVAAIVGLGHSLGLITVAEGIEKEAQADMLLCLGCEQGQGWLYGRPVDANGLPSLLNAAAHTAPIAQSIPGDGWAVSSLEALPTQRLAQLQAIYDGAPVGLCFLDCKLRYISLNQKLADMNGVSIESHLGRKVEEIFPDKFVGHRPYLLRALRGEAAAGIEITRRANESRDPDRTVLVSYQPVRDEGNEVVGVSVAVVDITDKRRTEEALRESDDRQQYLLKLNHQIPWSMDARGNNLETSAQWLQRTDIHEARNLGWMEALHPEDLEPTMSIMKDSLRTGRPIDIEYRICVDGKWQRMRSRGSPLYGPSGEILRWYGTVEEIDKPRMAESDTTEPVLGRKL